MPDTKNETTQANVPPISIHFEPTPNPASMKFVASQNISDETLSIENPLKANRSPLAQKLFGFPWVNSLFIGKNFITITKQEWVDWNSLAESVSHLIEEHLQNNEVVLHPLPSSSGDNSKDCADTTRIKEIIETEIRPAVAMDGGDIVFHKYENNIVYLLMQGACSGCPSAGLTLKMGIEKRLKKDIPDIKEVVSV